MKSALIIFVRNSILGKVKTRIANDLGDEAALHIYKQLLFHTHKITKSLPLDCFVFYADYINNQDLWSRGSYKKILQPEGDLGERMHTAFQQLFQNGYEKVCIIGSDCYELTTNIIEDAFKQLENKPAVIGPTFDGGYYLLGMNVLIPGVFQNKAWSTDTVFDATVESITQSGNNFFLLPRLSDVDNGEDCRRYNDLLLPNAINNL